MKIEVDARIEQIKFVDLPASKCFRMQGSYFMKCAMNHGKLCFVNLANGTLLYDFDPGMVDPIALKVVPDVG